MSMIDPTARVEDGAVIGEGTTIGPYCIIGRNVVIGENCNLISHVYVTAQTTIGGSVQGLLGRRLAFLVRRRRSTRARPATWRASSRPAPPRAPIQAQCRWRTG